MKMKKLLALLSFVLLALGCATDYEILKSFDSVILTADSSTKSVGQTITFTVKDNNGVNHTADAIFYVDGTAISGNTLTSAAVASFTVTASYYNVVSAPLTVTFHDGSEINFVKRVLIEDYTGTWCGYCPRVNFAIEQTLAQSDNVVAVGIHRPTSNMSSSTYDPYNYDTSVLEKMINVPGYPKGMLNRMTQWKSPEPDNISQAIALTQGENPKLGLALSPVVNGSNISLDVNVKFSSNFTGLKLVVYVVESGLIYPQHNYTDYYNSEDIIANYTHNHVLRACLTTSLFGDTIDGETMVGKTFTKNFSTTMPASVTNPAKVEFIAFVVDAAGNAVNVRKAAAGETQAFEEL